MSSALGLPTGTTLDAMRIVIAGGHGQIALLTTKLLSGRGDDVVGIVRNPDHVSDVEQAGGTAAVLDLEHTSAEAVADVLAGADAAVFAAGAGPGSGVDRKQTVDLGAAALFADAAQQAGVRRHVQISAMMLDRADDPSVGEVFQAYLRAKAAAEDDLRARDLAWTIVRPGRLTDDEATGSVQLGDHVDRAEIPRADVAAVLVSVLGEPRTEARTVEVVSGSTPIVDAVARFVAAEAS